MRHKTLLGIALIISTLTVYWQTGHHEFVSLDHDLFIGNAHLKTGLNTNNILWAFKPVSGVGWFPITWLSHMVDIEIYGMNPRGHHLTNVFVHAFATLILFILLNLLTEAPWKSAFVATLFALHPTHVESVAWVAERRDVLSAFFGFFCLLLYVKYLKNRNLAFYLLSISAFVLSLMSKPMLVTLPAIMLLLDHWPLNRFHLVENTKTRQRFKDIFTLSPIFKEKIPFFICSIVSAIITLNVPPNTGSTVKIDLWLRIENAITSYIKYIGKTFWPTDLAVTYPYYSSIPLWQVIGSLLIILAITTAVTWSGRHHPYLVAGWFWFIITLIPVLGIIQFGTQSMADRYTYLSTIGLFIMIAWGVPELPIIIPYQKTSIFFLGFIAATIMAFLTYDQLKVWKNDITLYSHAIKVTSGNFIAHNNLGVALKKQGLIDEAIEQYKKALEIRPDDVDVRYNLGLAFAEKNMLFEANREFAKVLMVDKNYFKKKTKTPGE